ncbi:MAG TPA: glycosyltransferase family 2 protein [Verrucomicrobiae bacterium]|nr:glycosyltransferase family 2 protein [Verrucomicrobiae bacterium]
MQKVLVVIPNWNGADDIRTCLDSLRQQTLQPHIVVVDNGSTDDSVDIIEAEYPEVEIIRHTANKGYAGGVNPGFRVAIDRRFDYAAPLNNDAVADKNWLRYLSDYLSAHHGVGIAASKLVSIDGAHIDSTGDQYTNWGLPYPRGRGETDIDKYDKHTAILGASGGSSMYRVSMLQKIGLFDEDFFAYYEDVDLSLRAQLAGWKVAFVPESIVYHQISATGSRIKGFFTLQTVKNLPWILIKDLPAGLFWRVLPRFLLAQLFFVGRAVLRRHGWYALKAITVTLWLMPKKLVERHRIQSTRKVPASYIWSIMTHDLPPQAANLRRLRAAWWKLQGKR